MTANDNHRTVTLTFEEYEEITRLIDQLQVSNGELKKRNGELEKDNGRLEKLNSELESANTSIAEELQKVMEQITVMRRDKFGSKSEKSKYILADGTEQLAMDFPEFNEAEKIADDNCSDTNENDESTGEKETITYTRKKGRKTGKNKLSFDEIPEGMDVEVKNVCLEGEDLNCPICGEQMHEIGFDTVRRLKIDPPRVYIEEVRVYRYGCRNCEKNSKDENGKAPVVSAKAEPAVLAGSNVTSDTIAYILTMKYLLYTPLYRIEKFFELMGLGMLNRQNFSQWQLKVTEKYFRPIFERMHELLLTEDILYSDDTVAQVLKEKGYSPKAEHRVWVYLTGKYGKRQIVLYQYTATRKRENVLEFLPNWTGRLHVDGCPSYKGIEGIILVECWSHCRRKFSDALEAIKDKKLKKGSSAAKGIAYCDELFAIENEMEQHPEWSLEERLMYRQEKATPVIEAFYAWLETINPGEKTKLGVAKTYAINQKEELCTYLSDARLEICNNASERAIKPFVMGRKNWLFHVTPRGAASSCIIYSLIETAKRNDRDPYAYLKWVMDTGAGLDMGQTENVDKLLPWNAPQKNPKTE